MKALIESQCNYCPLVWMFHSRTLNNRINRLHERALRLVYKNDQSSFEELLNKDNSLSIHHRNLQKLVTENNLSSTITSNIFTENNNVYDLRNKREFKTVRTVLNGTETVSYRGPQIWVTLPNSIKTANSLIEFKAQIKHWKPIECKCRICGFFIRDFGFI